MDSSRADEPIKTPRSKVMSAASTLVVLLALVLLVLELIPVNEYLFLPGDALPVVPMISVQGHPPPPHRENLLMTDVSEQPIHHKLEELWGRLNADGELQPASAVIGNVSPSKYNRANVRAMNDSVQQAEAAALGVTNGYRALCSRQGPVIVDLRPGSPAAKSVKPLDVVESVNGHRIHCAKQLGQLIKRGRVGDTVRLDVLRGRRHMTLRLRTIRASRASSTPIIGVLIEDRLRFPKLPIKISIRVGNIGGPSAGMMFALGIVELVRHQDLTHGCKVAGTGTIDIDGVVGEIGGVRQKIAAARRSGVAYFLVPHSNYKDGHASRGSVKVVAVGSLRQALHFLRGIPPCR